MSNQDDPLASLWQSQPVQTIEPAELKTMWQKNRKRQWCWFAGDMASMIFAVVFCSWIVLYDENLFMRLWGGMFLLFALVVSPYIFKLRYRSLGGGVPTAQYLERLIEQKHNNITMVRLSTWIIIFISVAFPIWSNAYFLYAELSAGVQFYKVLRASGVMLVMTTIMAIWGKYEIKKNERELEKFSKLSQES